MAHIRTILFLNRYYHHYYMENKPRALNHRITWWLALPKAMVRKLKVHYLHRFAAPIPFSFDGKDYLEINHLYNITILCERAVEIPIVWTNVLEAEGKTILEIGNVLGHYYPISHEVLDKYEKGPGVINEDVATFNPLKKYDLIVSISTMEHVGWDEEPRDTGKVITAFQNIECMLNDGGKAVITVPISYNSILDEKIWSGGLVGWTWKFMIKIGELTWREGKLEETKGMKFNYPFPHANCVAIGYYKKKVLHNV
jgi:hypothetical protein